MITIDVVKIETAAAHFAGLIVIGYLDDPGANAPGFMLSPVSQAPLIR
jgi:hypothetical protein